MSSGSNSSSNKTISKIPSHFPKDMGIHEIVGCFAERSCSSCSTPQSSGDFQNWVTTWLEKQLNESQWLNPENQRTLKLQRTGDCRWLFTSVYTCFHMDPEMDAEMFEEIWLWHHCQGAGTCTVATGGGMKVLSFRWNVNVDHSRFIERRRWFKL